MPDLCGFRIAAMASTLGASALAPVHHPEDARPASRRRATSRDGDGLELFVLFIADGTAELGGIQMLIGTAGGKQLGVRSLLDDSAVDRGDRAGGGRGGGKPG